MRNVPPTPYECAQRRLQLFFDGTLCAWCKYPFKPIYRAGLCRHCYSIKTELRQKYRAYVARKAKSRTPHDLFMAEFELRVAINMAEAAQLEGRMYGALDKNSVSNLDLEHAFSDLSRGLLGGLDLYRHDANLFECFTESQNRYLMYLLSRMLREYKRRHHRQRVSYKFESLDQTLRNRASGTYRVEDDPKVSVSRKKR